MDPAPFITSMRSTSIIFINASATAWFEDCSTWFPSIWVTTFGESVPGSKYRLSKYRHKQMTFPCLCQYIRRWKGWFVFIIWSINYRECKRDLSFQSLYSRACHNSFTHRKNGCYGFQPDIGLACCFYVEFSCTTSIPDMRKNQSIRSRCVSFKEETSVVTA